MAETENEKLLTLVEVATMTSLSQSTIRRLINTGKFPAPLRLGQTGRAIRFRPAEIRHYLNNL